jgi:hypothetical protein
LTPKKYISRVTYEEHSYVYILQQVIELWEMVKCMIEVPLISTSSIKDTRLHIRTQAAFVDKAREYLEQM